MSIVGAYIQREREKQGYSQNALAKKAKIAQATLNAIERQTKSPSIDTIMLISEALQVPVSVLLGERVISNADLIGDEIKLVEIFRLLNQAGKAAVLANAEAMLGLPDMRQEEPISSMG